MNNGNSQDVQRISTAVVFFAALCIFFVGSIWFKWLFVIYMIIIAALSALELSNSLKKKFRPLFLISILLNSLTFLAPIIVWFKYRDLENWYILKYKELPLSPNWLSNFVWLLSYGIMVFVIVKVLVEVINIVVRIISKGPKHLAHAVAENVAGSYISIAFVSVTLFTYAVPHGFFWLAFAIFTPMVVDVAAYFVGNWIGKKHMLPTISPHKTWEGFWAGLFAGTAFGALFFMIFFSGGAPLMSLGKAAVLGLAIGFLVALAAQFGDWVASSIKRWCEQKDFSNLLPGHGGILDRFDSIMFSLPTCLLLSLLFNLLNI